MCNLLSGIGTGDLLGVAFDGISSGFEASSRRKEALAARATARYRSDLATRRAEVADILAADEIVIGQKESNILRQRGNQLKATQRTNAAASGIQANFGSPVDVLTGTEAVLQIDEAVIKDNAERKAFGHKVNALDLLSEAAFQTSVASRSSSDFGVASTLITSAGRSAIKFL